MKKSALSLGLKNIIAEATPQLLLLTDTETFSKPAPEKWSKKEILGHLIDSAANNHQRFVRGQSKEDMIFSGYAQAEWVKIQHYQSKSWKDIVELWAAYNLQIAHIIHYMPDAIRFRAISQHNLHKIAFRTVPEQESTCLEYFMVDYVGHVEHHLKQILKGYEAQLGIYSNNFHLP